MKKLAVAPSLRARFQTQWDAPVHRGFVVPGVSDTKASKSLSLRELIQRDQSELVTPTAKAEPWFDETVFVPNLKSMDLVDIDRWKQSLELQLVEVNKQVKAEYDARKAKEDAAKAAKAAKAAAKAAAQSSDVDGGD